MIVVGRIAGLFGVRGWVKVFSETEPRENILGYSPWFLGEDHEPKELMEGKRHGKGLVARVKGCDDRDQAAALVGQQIAVCRSQLPPPGPDEFYWTDLIGLSVTTETGTLLGKVERLFGTTSNDVMVVDGDRERLIPFIWGDVIKEIDLGRGSILIDWDPAF
jgi:16S rRNA processing protein RimM